MFQIPIYRDGKVVGGLYEAYPVELLQNAYHGSTYNDAGYSYVLDDNGSIVLAPVRFSYLQIYSTIQDVLKDGENDEESIRKFSAALRSQASGTAVFDFEGEKQFLTFMPLMQKQNWYYVSVIPVSYTHLTTLRHLSSFVRRKAVFCSMPMSVPANSF